MKVPNIQRGRVLDRKIGYLLRPTNKGGFWSPMGYSTADPRQFRDDLLRHAQVNEVARVETTMWGTKYVVEGPMRTPSRRRPRVRSVWIVDAGATAPRLLTAYSPS